MIFSITRDNGGPQCAKCGSGELGVSTVVRRGEGYTYGTVTVCEECIFKTVLGDTAYQRAVNKASKPIMDVGEEVRMKQSDYISLLQSCGEVKPKRWWQL